MKDAKNEKCPNCGACKECGAHPQPQFIPYPHYVPYAPYRPYPGWTGYPQAWWGVSPNIGAGSYSPQASGANLTAWNTAASNSH